MEKEARPRFDRKVIALQVSLAEIESAAGVSFARSLHDVDVKADDAPVELQHDMQNLKKKAQNKIPV